LEFPPDWGRDLVQVPGTDRAMDLEMGSDRGLERERDRATATDRATVMDRVMVTVLATMAVLARAMDPEMVTDPVKEMATATLPRRQSRSMRCPFHRDHRTPCS
jgi:hypothetical protein